MDDDAGSQLAGQMARLPFEGVCIDMQHGMIGFSDAVDMIAAISNAGRPAIVRVLWNEPGLIGQSLDAGAAAVIVPMVNSKAQAEALVKAAKYPPLGGRSWGGYTAFQTYGLSPADYLQKANTITQVFAMIETQAALDAVEEIAAVPGLDGLFVGPSDLVHRAFQGGRHRQDGQAHAGRDEARLPPPPRKTIWLPGPLRARRCHQDLCGDGLYIHGRGR